MNIAPVIAEKKAEIETRKAGIRLRQEQKDAWTFQLQQDLCFMEP